LPAGLTCAKGTGTISGYCTTPAITAGFKIKAWNISGVDSCYDTVTVVLGRPHITYKRAINLQRGVALVPDSIINAGGAIDSFAISGTLPVGLAFNKTTGIISGVIKDTVYYVKAYNGTDTNSTAVRVRYLPTTQSFKFGF
jgi:hypothetical protein